MTLGQTICQSLRAVQRAWLRRADEAFGKAVPPAHDEICRGEFISAFISDRDLSFPRVRTALVSRR